MQAKQLGIIIKPPTAKSSIGVANLLKSKNFEAIFLNLPRSMDSLMTEYILGLSYEEMLEGIRRDKLLPEPVEVWLKETVLILDGLKEEKSDLRTFCYREDGGFRAEVNNAINIALLMLRDSIREEVSVKEWLEALSRERDVKERVEEEVNYITEEAVNYEESVCVSGFEGRGMKKRIERVMQTWIAYVGLPYHFTPLEILKRELSRGEVSEERVRELVKQHIKFIRELVIPKDFETALEDWTRKNLYWMGKRFLRGGM